MLHQIIKWENILNTTGATSGSGTAYSPTGPEITYGFSRVHVAQSLVFCVVLCLFRIMMSDYPFRRLSQYFKKKKEDVYDRNK
jgi:hypothetical protein